jgi:uncharacterized coiled-coil protein SlyX
MVNDNVTYLRERLDKLEEKERESHAKVAVANANLEAVEHRLDDRIKHLETTLTNQLNELSGVIKDGFSGQSKSINTIKEQVTENANKIQALENFKSSKLTVSDKWADFRRSLLFFVVTTLGSAGVVKAAELWKK